MESQVVEQVEKKKKQGKMTILPNIPSSFFVSSMMAQSVIPPISMKFPIPPHFQESRLHHT